MFTVLYHHNYVKGILNYYVCWNLNCFHACIFSVYQLTFTSVWYGLYEELGARSSYLEQGWVTTSCIILWNVVTYSCHRHLLPTPQATYNKYIRQCHWCFDIVWLTHWYVNKMDKFSMLIQFLLNMLKFVFKGPINTKSFCVQVMTRYQVKINLLPKPFLTQFTNT